jgi:hypothetical protein
MKNLNEPLRDVPAERPAEIQQDPQVIPIGGYRGKSSGESSLISKREIEDLRGRWTTVQSTFVDNPRKAVEEASALVSSAIEEIDERFKNRRTEIDKQSKGASATTEDLRVALQQYRDFFDRLLSL